MAELHPCYHECGELLNDAGRYRQAGWVARCHDPGWSPYDRGYFTCPHGLKYWLRPTTAQLMQWAREQSA